MTELYIDGSILEYEDTEGDSTIGECIDSINADLFKHKRLIFKIIVDGEEAKKTDSQEFKATHIRDHKVIDFTTITLAEITLNGINVCKDIILYITKGIATITENLRAGADAEAFRLFHPLFDSLNELVATITAVDTNIEHFNEVLFKSSPSKLCDQLVKHLGEILKSRDAGDTILVADLLEYEVSPLIEELERLLLNASSTDETP